MHGRQFKSTSPKTIYLSICKTIWILQKKGGGDSIIK